MIIHNIKSVPNKDLNYNYNFAKGKFKLGNFTFTLLYDNCTFSKFLTQIISHKFYKLSNVSMAEFIIFVFKRNCKIFFMQINTTNGTPTKKHLFHSNKVSSKLETAMEIEVQKCLPFTNHI